MLNILKTGSIVTIGQKKIEQFDPLRQNIFKLRIYFLFRKFFSFLSHRLKIKSHTTIAIYLENETTQPSHSIVKKTIIIVLEAYRRHSHR